MIDARLGPVLPALLLTLGTSLSAPPVAAQEEAPVVAERRGWIGISMETRIVDEGAAGETGPMAVMVTRVLPDSPARDAGLRAGDRILRLDGAPATPRRFERLARRLRPGQTVSLAVERDGEIRTVEVEAAERPRAVFPPLPPEVAVHLDSVRTAVLREFDSLRIRLRGRRGEPVHFTFRGDTAVAFRVDGEGERVTLMRREVAPPLSEVDVRTFLPDSGREVRFRQLLEGRTEGAGSLSRLRELQEDLFRARRSEEALRLRLRRVRARGGAVPDTSLRRLESLQERSESLSRELEALYRRMSRDEAYALRPLPPRPGARSGTPAPRGRVDFDAPRPPRSVVPLTPRVVGHSYVAGARLQPLNPGLAEYFRVEEGVLITEVVTGSPAAESDLRAGDVVVAVAGEPVTDLQGLRGALADAGSWPVDVEVVRKGERRTLTLRR